MKKNFFLFGLVCLLLVQGAWGSGVFVYSPKATIVYSKGDVVLVRNGQKRGVSLSETLVEGDTVKTGRHGFCIVKLENGEKLSIQPNMEVTLWVFFHSPSSGSWGVSFKAIKGKIEAPFLLLWGIKQKGIDFEDESPNTLACSKG